MLPKLRHTLRTLSIKHRPEQKKLDIINGDFMQTELDYFDVFISNTPYQVARPCTDP